MGAKVLNAQIFLFYRRCTADFCFAPPYGKNQKVDRFIKRLQKKSNCSLDTHLLSISAPTGIINVPADFYTIEMPSSGIPKGITKGFRGQILTSEALVCFIQLLISAVPKSGGAKEFKPCGVRISE